MNLPNLLTSSRIVLAPIFALCFFLPSWLDCSYLPFYIVAWVLFVLIELTDALDGAIARKLGMVSDLGKVLDPFADVIARLTYFLVFTSLGIMPAWIFLLLMYRELSQTFLRMVMMGRGTALAARTGGKIKAILYSVAGGFGLVDFGLRHFQFSSTFTDPAHAVTLGVFVAALIVSLVSFADYIIVFASSKKS